jgi:alkanesulfonate monooxygenase SsuD/methylene tetrahydromethanopterin reductase-like flavin-dependent oxidoreductase (luciferase family)
MHPLRFGLKLSQAATIDTLTTIWGIADDSGFDHCWNMDHFASLGGDDTLDIFEAWTLLAGMAART